MVGVDVLQAGVREVAPVADGRNGLPAVLEADGIERCEFAVERRSPATVSGGMIEKEAPSAPTQYQPPRVDSHTRGEVRALKNDSTLWERKSVDRFPAPAHRAGEGSPPAQRRSRKRAPRHAGEGGDPDGCGAHVGEHQ